MGTPKEAAHEVLSNLLDKKINEAPAQKNNRQILHIALLALLAAPIGIPLGIAILVTLFAILVAALTVILAFFAVSILGIIGGFLFLVESFTVLAQAKSAFILIFGSGLLAIGASSLVLLGISYVTRFFGLLIVRLVQFVLKKGKRGNQHA
ncbi:membrane protein [Streptococcus pneumoniae]|nr:membrane protein [Streptococcus pneumoniae]